MRRTSLVLLLTAALAVPSAGPVAAQQGPPPTPVPPFGSPSPYPSSLATPEPSARPPDLTAPSVLLMDVESGAVLYGRRPRQRRPVASTTKVMTALLVLEATRPADPVTVSPNAASQLGAGLGLRAGERITVRQLLYALMLQSSNDAAVALAEHVAGSVEGFVREMNRRARGLGLTDTNFRSPNGLDDAGYSTAHDLGVITLEAFRHPIFADVARTRFRTIPAPEGPARRIQNRNALLWLYGGATGVKTGWTSAAGFCLVASAERGGLHAVAVVLGAPDEAFTDAATLLDHGFAGYVRRVVVEEGHSVEPLRVEGRDVPVGAGAELEALLRRGREPVLLARPDPGLVLPLGEGDQVGTIEVRTGSERLGEVPLVVLEPVGAEEPERAIPEGEPSWWSLALEWAAGVWDGLAGALR